VWKENYFNFPQKLSADVQVNCICRSVVQNLAQIIHTAHIAFISAAFKIMDCKDKSDNNCHVIDDSPQCWSIYNGVAA